MNLNVVKHLSNRTAVMYLGQIVETAPTKILNENASHPYTRALLAAQPSTNPKESNEFTPLSGDVPSPLNPSSRVPFSPPLPRSDRPLQNRTTHNLLFG